MLMIDCHQKYPIKKHVTKWIHPVLPKHFAAEDTIGLQVKVMTKPTMTSYPT